MTSFRNNNAWLRHHPCEAKVFADLDAVWAELKDTYEGDFRNLVYGKFPEEAEVAATLHRIKQRLESIEWTIIVEGKA
jgi:hypothetical protein